MTGYETDLITLCLEKIRQFARVELVTQDDLRSSSDIRTDRRIRLVGKDGQEIYCSVEIKRNFRKEIDLPMNTYSKIHMNNEPTILLTTYVSRKLAELLREQHVNFIDISGNMHFDLPWLKIFIAGNPRLRKEDTKIPLTNASALKVIFTLLACKDAMTWTYRETAAKATVSLGSLGAIYEALRWKGFMQTEVKNGNFVRHIINADELYNLWQIGYSETLRRKLLVGSYRLVNNAPVTELVRMMENVSEEHLLLGGELGATVHEAGVLHPGAATLHLLPNADLTNIIIQLRLIPDKNGNVVLLRTFGRCNVGAKVAQNSFNLAHPLLIYAELTQTNDPRVREFAKTYYANCVLPGLNS